jgi:hypothetical protein
MQPYLKYFQMYVELLEFVFYLTQFNLHITQSIILAITQSKNVTFFLSDVKTFKRKFDNCEDSSDVMWSNVVFPTEARVPTSRSKHASILHGQFLYLLGGRNGNVPLKDFWRYCICK